MTRRNTLGFEIRIALYAARRQQGLTQAEVARRMGTTQSAVSDLERGDYDPQLSTFARWSAALGKTLYVTLDDLTITLDPQEDTDGTS